MMVHFPLLTRVLLSSAGAFGRGLLLGTQNMAPAPIKPHGVISALEAYTLEELKRRLGIETEAWGRLRRAGCRFIASGKRRLVLGSEVIRVLEELQAQDAESKK